MCLTLGVQEWYLWKSYYSIHVAILFLGFDLCVSSGHNVSATFLTLEEKGNWLLNFWASSPLSLGHPRWCNGKESTFQFRSCRRHGFDPWVRKIPWSRKWQPIPIFLLENSMDRGPWKAIVHWGHEESDTTADTCISLFSYLFEGNTRMLKIYQLVSYYNSDIIVSIVHV